MPEVPDRLPGGARTFWPGAVVVITGATSGIGRAAALAFAAAGARLVLTGRRPDALAEAVEACRRLGADAVGQTADIVNREEVEALAALARERYGALDVWVSCAAVLQYGRFDETPADIAEQVVRTNLLGTFNSARIALQHFRRQGRGVLITTSSVLGLVGHAYTAAYVASKFAIRGLTLSLRQEMKNTPGVHVCAVLPAAIDTPIYGRAANYTGWGIQPIRPLYAPEAVARVILRQARRPRRERFAGAFTGVVTFGASMVPLVMERLIRLVADVPEITHEPCAPTPGNVRHPVSDGFTVDGGWRRRYGLSADGRVLAAALSVLGLGLGAGVAAAARRRR